MQINLDTQIRSAIAEGSVAQRGMRCSSDTDRVQQTAERSLLQHPSKSFPNIQNEM